VLVPPP